MDDVITTVNAPYYNIFEKEVEDISTESLQYLEYYDWNLNGVSSLTDFRIEVNDRENWFIPQKAYLECRFSINHTDGTILAGFENVSPQNNGVGFFKTWELWMETNPIERVDDADVCNTIQSLVYFSKQYSETIAENQFWYPDTVNGSALDYLIPIQAGNDDLLLANMETINLGHRKRQQFINQVNVAGGAPPKQATIHIPLMNVFGFLKSYFAVMKGINLNLRLTKNDDFRTLLCPANNCVLNINWVSLWIPRVKPYVTVLSKLEARLASEAVHLVPFVDTQIFRSNLQQNAANNELFQIKTKRRRPIKLFIAFQNQNRVTGNQTIVKRIFDDVMLTKLRVVLNGTDQYPEREYSCNFSNDRIDLARVYNELMRVGLKDHDIHEGSVVTPSNFESLFPIFCIDMTNQSEHSVVPNSALIDVYWSTDGIANPYYMWVLVESERQLEMASSQGKMRFVKLVQ